MSNLMELVNTCSTYEVNEKKLAEAASKALELNELGFSNAAGLVMDKVNKIAPAAKLKAHKFICIKPEQIQDFLLRKMDEYNSKAYSKKAAAEWREKVLKPGAWEEFAGWSGDSKGEINYSVPTKDYTNGAVGTTGKFAWKEKLARNYAGVPPEKVLNRLKEVKALNVFDEFSVATVSAVHDPLLLGQLKGSNFRWFIAQWGDDVCLDDLI